MTTAPAATSHKKAKKLALNGRLPPRRPTRIQKARVFSTAEINQRVEKLLSTDGSFLRTKVIELLYNFIALTEEQLFRLCREEIAITENAYNFGKTLNKYRADGLIVELPYDVMKKAKRAGLRLRDEHVRYRAWQLGPVGEKYAKETIGGETPAAPAGNDHRVHDLLCAEVMLRMREAFMEKQKVKAEVRGPREVAVWDDDKDAFLLMPDGLVVKYKPDGTTVDRAYLIEYHNTSRAERVRQKIEKYEEVGKADYNWIWSEQLELEGNRPFVLAVYRQEATYQRYKTELTKQNGALAWNYVSLNLAEVWAGNPLNATPLKINSAKK